MVKNENKAMLTITDIKITDEIKSKIMEEISKQIKDMAKEEYKARLFNEFKKQIALVLNEKIKGNIIYKRIKEKVDKVIQEKEDEITEAIDLAEENIAGFNKELEIIVGRLNRLDREIIMLFNKLKIER